MAKQYHYIFNLKCQNVTNPKNWIVCPDWVSKELETYMWQN